MKKFFLLLFICLIWANASGSLVMVRADSNETYLSSPSKMNLTDVIHSFNPNVDTIVYIHGYMNDFNGAKSQYSGAVNIMKPILGDRNYIGFHWPSKVIWFGTAIKNANKAGEYLVYALTEINKFYNGNGRKIHVVCHSLGGRVLLDTLACPEAPYLPWGNLCLMAPAVHSNAHTTDFPGTYRFGKAQYVYHSKKDGILKYLYTLYYWLFGKGREELEYNRNAEMEAWLKKSWEEQRAYLANLEKKIANGWTPTSELDKMLAESLKISATRAMGISGSQIIGKVINMNYTQYAPSHSSYWGSEILKKIASEKLK